MLSVVTYNILADCAFAPDQHKQYDGVDPDTRYTRILDKLQQLQVDVICLQEVMEEHFCKHIQPSLGARGYQAVTYKRSDDLSLATFFKSNTFSLLDDYHFILQDKCREFVQDQGIDKLHAKAVEHYTRHDRPYSMLLVKLQHKDTGIIITVGNIHILWDKFQRNDAKALMAACAMKTLLSFNNGSNMPHIICGDFNSYPDSPLYHLMEHGFVDEGNMKQDNIKGRIQCQAGCRQHDEPVFLYDILPEAVRHTTSLKSIFKAVNGQEPEITSYDVNDCHDVAFTGCYDYIWFSSEHMDASEAQVDEVTWADVRRMLEDPTTMKHVPSDHLPVSGSVGAPIIVHCFIAHLYRGKL